MKKFLTLAWALAALSPGNVKADSITVNETVTVSIPDGLNPITKELMPKAIENGFAALNKSCKDYRAGSANCSNAKLSQRIMADPTNITKTYTLHGNCYYEILGLDRSCQLDTSSLRIE